MIKKLIRFIDPAIDYKGQSFCKSLMFYIFAVGYFLSLVTGLLFKNIKLILYGGILTVILNGILTIPSWSYFRMNPLKFKKEKKD